MGRRVSAAGTRDSHVVPLAHETLRYILSAPFYAGEDLIVAGTQGRRRVAETETIGERSARLRKERGLTQQEMAERLALAQPNVSDYERGILRLHGELIAQILQVSADELLGLTPSSPRAGTATNRRFQRRLQELDQLPVRDQQAVLRTLDAFLSKTRSATNGHERRP
jgi:transcriptional regulator with XRE-family HTH domain